jgi:Winged helix DNA-binding domain
VLYESGFVEICKWFRKNRSLTVCRITDEGRRRFLEVITVLENVVADALVVAKAVPAPCKFPTQAAIFPDLIETRFTRAPRSRGGQAPFR